MYYNGSKILKVKGQKKMKGFEKLRMTRQMEKYKKNMEKMKTTKINKSCYLDILTRSIQR